jgi:predicted nucleotidyltransferase
MRKETLLKIMGLFRKNIDQGLTIMEISKKLKIGYRPAYNHIKAMSEERIINIKRVGRAKQCFLNLRNEKCRHILEEVDMIRKENLFKKNVKLRDVLEGLISKLTKRFVSEMHSVVLFGSYAKDKAAEDSDVDLLFIVTDMKNKRLREGIERECAGFQYSHNVKVSPIITDIREFRKMLRAEEGLNVGKEAREYGIPLYGFEQFWRLVV